MADISYHCHHCGSVHEVESIRENLYLNQRSIASYAFPWGRQAYPRAGIVRWRIARDIAKALWPRYRRGGQSERIRPAVPGSSRR